MAKEKKSSRFINKPIIKQTQAIYRLQLPKPYSIKEGRNKNE